jgi:hypothetical protein
MPSTPNVPVVHAMTGGILLLLAILGGGIQGKFIVPPLSDRMRMLSGGIGIVLIAIALVRSDTTSSPQPVTAQTPPTAVTSPRPPPGAPTTVISSIQWPATPQEAARLFANGIGDWELTEGGWHLKDRWPPIRVSVPPGVTMEGFNDGINPPRTRHCMVVLGPGQVEVQGATFWFPENPADPAATAQKVYGVQTAWPAASGGPTTCEAVGFQP